ncbi:MULTISPECIES: monofunctional biosynthetic peptidoglycan transglycosylase [Glaesserella]|uniref:Biosynthetic peptidoglycan transglycosylase n=1 Tax=Glaesserella australis TaxID=2094024 RepID=A0A328BZL1_9PAST|nr:MULTISPECIES: monofunctional biosynthetic peptidoglycan transglycosylase [Glaesserella]AUI65539.1 monofunctional biosynthetic peptidoglycan transglycosylase [Glaesserella sp. 15-184]RAL19736.1 monofunctional biosynthetic peptidoglycan transglycosylase [Glaesserella australis]
MAKRKKKSLKQKLLNFFIPKQIRSIKGWLWFSFSRIGLAIASFYVSLTLIFSVIPVPFSAYMVQKKIEHLIQADNYKIQYNWVSLDRISWQMQMAVIAGEDQRFPIHFGIDFDAIEAAIKRNSKSNKKPRGASTISQQTVKNLYLWHGTSWVRKGIEVPLTFLVESIWDKQRVLEVYLNIAEFGDGIFGVEAAAKHYFKKTASQLTLQESALLAAALPNPIIYRVKMPSQTMRNRQQWIIRQVNNLGGQSYLEKL